MRDRDERPLCLGLSKNWNKASENVARKARRQRGKIDAADHGDSLEALAAEVEKDRHGS